MDKRAFIDRIRSNFPDQLIGLAQWVCWRVEMRDGDPTKVPYTINGMRAESDNPATWSSFDEVCAAYLTGNYAGVGFMFSEHDPYTGVDFDKCVNGQEIDPRRAGWMNGLASYSEYSQSKTGIHTIVVGTLPPGGRKSRALLVEMYDRLRFFVVTGDHVPGTPLSLNERQQELTALHLEVFGKPKEKAAQNGQRSESGEIPEDDQELLRRMFASKNGAQIESLWRGNVNAYNDDHSAADLALCNYLAFWTGNDAERMDRLFRMSSLARDKWDRNARTGETYGEGTIARAIADTTQTYTPRVHTNGHNKTVAQGQTPAAEPENWTPNEAPPAEEQAQEIDVLIYRQEDGGILDAWVEHHSKNWIYATGADRWYHWQGAHWQLDEQLLMQKSVRELLDTMNQQCSQIIKDTPERIKRILDKYQNLQLPESVDKQIESLQKGVGIAEGMRKATKRTNGRISSIESMARSVNAKPISAFDIGEALNLANGTLDLHSLELLPHSADDLFTYRLEYDYDPNARCPLFEKFIAQVLVKEGTEETDWDLVNLFQELLGYSLTTQTKREVMVWMYGDGGNGKSVVISVIEALLGQMAASVDLQAIGTPGNYELADIPGKRVVFSTEAERGGAMAEGYLKRIVTGDTMKARPIYGTQFSFRSTAKVWWAMNDRPLIKDTSDSIWRRMKLIPFFRKFESGTADVNLSKKLKAELSGILNWAIDGLVRLSNNDKFTESSAAEIAKAQYREESNPVARWVNTMTVKTNYPATLQGALFENFNGWLRSQNEKPITSTQFGRDLGRMKIPKQRKGAGVMYSLALIDGSAHESM